MIDVRGGAKAGNSDLARAPGETERGQALDDLGAFEQGAEGADGGAVPPVLGDGEVVAFDPNGEEAEAVRGGHRGDRQAPVGPSLGDRGGDGVVRTGLDGVPGGASAPEQAVDQDAGAAP